MVKKIKSLLTKTVEKVKKVARCIKEKIVKHKRILKRIAIGTLIAVTIGVAINMALPDTIALADSGYTVSTISQTTNEGIKIEEAVKEKDGFFDKIRNFLDDKKEDAITNMQEKAQEKSDAILDEKLNWFQKKAIGFISGSVNTIFNLTTATLIKLPVELVANVSIMRLYTKLLVFGCAIMPIIIVFQYLKALLNNDENVEPLPLVIWNVLKSIIFMFGFGTFFHKAILAMNIITDSVLSIGYNQFGFNTVLAFMTGNGISILGVVTTIVSLFALMVFLLIVFFTTAVRYWDLCELFVKAPIAFGMGASSKSKFFYYVWLDNLKQVLLAQVFYALHLVIFAAVISNPFHGIPNGELISVMLLIGGIFKLMKVPGGLKDMLSRSHDEEKVLGLFKKTTNIAKKAGGGM